MALHVDIGDTGIDLSFTGLDQALCLIKHLRLHYGDIERAWVGTWDDVRPALGWRVAGGYWPGRFATGHFMVKGRPGARQLWDVYRDRELLVIDTRVERPCRVVLQHPDRVVLAERIEAGRTS